MQVAFDFFNDAKSGAVAPGVDSHNAHFCLPW
jgi:hypothetical protein